MSNKKKKVCVVCQSLGKGGAERSSAILTHILSDLGYEVFVVTITNKIDFSFKGRLLNLGILKDGKDNFKTYLKRIILFKRFINKHDIDLVIDSRPKNSTLKELLIRFFLYGRKNIIYVIHSYNLNSYCLKYRFLNQLIYKFNYKNISVSKAICDKVSKKYSLGNVSCIYNTFLYKKRSVQNEYDYEYALFYGRLDDKVKNLSFLIKSYKESILPSSGIKLLILGKGKDKVKLFNFVTKLGLNDSVIFEDYVLDPFTIVKNAKFVCLTSNYEGFPMVLVESLSLGTPVVSVDCTSGPNEIVKNSFNGLLIPQNDNNAYTLALNELVTDNNLYNYCKMNTISSVKKFSYTNIKNDWYELLKSIN